MPVPAECQSSQDEINPLRQEYQSPPSPVPNSPTPAKRMCDPTASGFAENPWEPPFIVSGRRINLADMQFSGVDIPAGTEILTVAASANRDPRVFGDDADEFKPERENARSHLSFGKGVHHCLGAALSRIETHVAVTRFLERFPEAHYAQQPTWRSRNFLRSLDNMTVDLN